MKNNKKRNRSESEAENYSSPLKINKTVTANGDVEIIKSKKRKSCSASESGDLCLPPNNDTVKQIMLNSSEGVAHTSKILSDAEFFSLEGKVSHETLQAVKDMGFTKMTEIQRRSIPYLLERRHLVGTAKTGSGKTLAFLIPAIERMVKLKFKPENGTGCIIITPTRELAMQIHHVLVGLMKYHNLSFGIIKGGSKRNKEVKMLQKGVNILIATPGRLLDHIRNTPHFMFSNLRCLIIDEADKILEIGFEKDLEDIISYLPEKRQTLLFSATNTKKVDDLRRLIITKEPVFIDVGNTAKQSTVDGLIQQGYVICPEEKKFLLLHKFLNLTKKSKRKVMVFFSSCYSVKYHDMICNSMGLQVTSIHGKKKQSSRTHAFFQFCNAETGILFCTDVAARGLDIPSVDWIIQYDLPDDTKEYIHRVGRTARGEEGIGRAIMFLRPTETAYIQYLKAAKVPVEELEFDWNKALYDQDQLENLVNNNYDLREAAKKGFLSCVRSYKAHQLKEVFDVHKLDLTKLAKTFGLAKPPNVHLGNT